MHREPRVVNRSEFLSLSRPRRATVQRARWSDKRAVRRCVVDSVPHIRDETPAGFSEGRQIRGALEACCYTSGALALLQA
jgi:hypothetical protein